MILTLISTVFCSLMLCSITATLLWTSTTYKKPVRLPKLLVVHKSQGVFGTRQKREGRVPMSFHQTFDACRDAQKILHKTVIHRLNRDEGFIQMHKSLSLHTSGSIIDIQLIPFDAQSTYITITSRPKLITIIFDSGHNKKIVEHIVAHLEQRASHVFHMRQLPQHKLPQHQLPQRPLLP